MLEGPEGLQRWPMGNRTCQGSGGILGGTPISRALESIVLIIPGTPEKRGGCWEAVLEGRWSVGQRDGRQEGWKEAGPDPQVALASPPLPGSSGWDPWAHCLPSTQGGPIVSRDTGRCLEVEMSKDANFSSAPGGAEVPQDRNGPSETGSSQGGTDPQPHPEPPPH